MIPEKSVDDIDGRGIVGGGVVESVFIDEVQTGPDLSSLSVGSSKIDEEVEFGLDFVYVLDLTSALTTV